MTVPIARVIVEAAKAVAERVEGAAKAEVATRDRRSKVPRSIMVLLLWRGLCGWWVCVGGGWGVCTSPLELSRFFVLEIDTDHD